MGYWVKCSCGNRMEVAGTQAGLEISCPCGRMVRVPPWSVLRREAGESAYEPGPEMVIRHVYGSGDPEISGRACALCASGPVHQVLCRIECEKPVRRGEHSWLFWLFFGLLAPAYAIFYSFVKGEPEVVSEGTVLEVLLPLCSSCLKQKPGAAKEALRRHPDFARLFDKFPAAKVSLSLGGRPGRGRSR